MSIYKDMYLYTYKIKKHRIIENIIWSIIIVILKYVYSMTDVCFYFLIKHIKFLVQKSY